MKTLLKVIIGLVVVLVLVVGAAVLILPSVLDPNDYKDKITAEVKAATGRELEIAGDISLTYFPWLGVQLGAVKLSNATGFSAPTFAQVERVAIRVKLMPLFSKRVEMDTVTVHGLALNLEKNAKGKTNWDDLIERSAKPAAPTDSGESPIAALAVGGLDVKDGTLTWIDAQQKQKFAVRELNVETGALSPGAIVPLSLSMKLEGGPPAITGTLTLSASVAHDPSMAKTLLTDLEVTGSFSGDSLPGGKADFKLGADVAFDAKSGVATLADLEASGLGLALTGSLEAKTKVDPPSYSGRIAIAQFDAKALLSALGQSAPETADPAVLGRVSVEAQVAGGGDRVTVKPLTVKLDDSTLTGELTLASIARQAARFDLSLDSIDLDRYLPPAKKDDAAATPGTAAGGGATQLPMDTLRSLDVNGKVVAGRVKVAKLTMTDVAATLTAKDGLIRLSPIAAKLYEGVYAGDISLDARKDRPQVSLNEKLSGIQAGPLLKDLQGEARLTGKGDVSAKLSAIGADADSVKKTLGGEVRFLFADGALVGINIARMIREGLAKLKGQTLPPDDSPAKTDFAELSGSVSIKDGNATNQDLVAKSPLLRLRGAGEANLPTEKVDYTIKASVVATTQGQGGKELGDLAGITIPVRVSGTFSEPSYGLNMEALAQEVAKSKAGELVEKQKEKVGAAIKEKAGAAGGETVKKLLGGEQGGGVLKGLLSN